MAETTTFHTRDLMAIGFKIMTFPPLWSKACLLPRAAVALHRQTAKSPSALCDSCYGVQPCGHHMVTKMSTVLGVKPGMVDMDF